LIYVIKPFLPETSRHTFPSHQNVRTCQQIAAMVGEFGFIVDIADVRDTSFKPSRDYDIVISNRATLTGQVDAFRTDAVRIYLATSSHCQRGGQMRLTPSLLDTCAATGGSAEFQGSPVDRTF
jgi:hypothetical protein